ncbi:glycosyltransferase family 4 protein [candidate division WWE3 bacterium]|nr:glycosyltransferase family 4 protein [candidate division WWE3 bacterium]
MKKILFYIPTFPIFSENFILREIEALSTSDYLTLTILSLTKGRSDAIPEHIRNKVTYFKRPVLLRSIDFLLYCLARPFRALKVILKYKERLFSVGTAVSMLKTVKRLSPDHIHANWITDGALIANIISDLTGIPFSVECHAVDIWTTKPRILKDRISDSKFVVTCTKFNSDYLKSLCPLSDQAKIFTVYHYLGKDTFNERSAQFSELPVIYMVGRMVEKKGFDVALKAFKILKEKGVRFRVRIAGDPGTLKAKLESMVDDYGLAHLVFFTGEVTFREHSHNYLESDIFVAPSRRLGSGDMDGIPNVIVEAMLAGLPVVATDLSAIPELVKDSVNGYLVSEGDFFELALKIEDLIGDLEKRKTFGSAGRAKVIEMFGYENTVKKLERLLLT